MSNSLDPDQALHYVQPDLGPNCLQRLSADNTSRQGVLEALNTVLHLSFLDRCSNFDIQSTGATFKRKSRSSKYYQVFPHTIAVCAQAWSKSVSTSEKVYGCDKHIIT